ncbi:helix-turn-helix domain-containing protein [Porcincola intestinalis]|uniref:Helix-turn-helix transcriptional regulator n=1 Tax=Porcincola intestinalis TaxID=2606632 RepID=A0A6L5X3P1_9FIRM|nr:helix-turn-helix domain-containing protein [Porcincola intestinalis]MSS13993.1 helix-turn-helix transcriptional regulator [Porcincola intestinalis]
MVPAIDQKATGRQIHRLLKLRGFTVQDVKERLMLGCVQSVYHWLDGQSLPSLDNLYALSRMLRVPMDRLIIGTEDYEKTRPLKRRSKHLLYYGKMVREGIAA